MNAHPSGFTVQDGIKIQDEHLADLKAQVSDKVYRRIEKWAKAGNKHARWGDEVRRGDDLTDAVKRIENKEPL